MVFKIAKIAVLKLFAYKNGALFLVNGSFSAILTVHIYLRELTKGTETKNLLLPIVIFVMGFIVFHFFSLIDLITGIQNAKYQNSILPKPAKNYIKSYKLWFTIWKNLGITVFGFMVMLICLLAEVMDNDLVYYILVWFLVTVWSMGSAFEFHSIGDNIEKRTGSRPPMFGLIETITSLAQKGIILRTKKSFNIPDKMPGDEEDEGNLNTDENEKSN